MKTSQKSCLFRTRIDMKLLTTAVVALLILVTSPLLAQRDRGGFRGRRIEPEDMTFDLGLAEIPDRATFEKISYKGEEVFRDAYLANLEFVKFCVDKADPKNPKIYFMNTKIHRAHPRFMPLVGISTRERGAITYLPRLTNPCGEPGLYIVDFEPNDSYTYEQIKEFLDLLTEKMPLLKGRVAFHPLQGNVRQCERDKEKYKAGGIAVHLDEDLYKNIAFLPLNSAQGFGVLRIMDANDRPSSRDVVVYKTLPNQMPRVAGVITEVRQTPLSHVNLRAVQDKIPNAFIKDASSAKSIEPLVGKLVCYEVNSQGFKIREASKAEVDKHFEKLRPSKALSPTRNLSKKTIEPLSNVTFKDSESFGVKASNLAVLRSIKLKADVPDGFGIPFYFYDEFMKHNEFYAEFEKLSKLPEFSASPDREKQITQLKDFRAKIESGTMPEWMLDALAKIQKEFPEGSSIRCRSSTNNEDLPGFSGAGLYDSYTHKPTEGHLAKSVKQVYASLWNFRAFEEREFYRVEHAKTAMGVLLHPNYKGEKANGVAVTDDILYETSGYYFVNSQIGEDLVTNPDQSSSPEEVLLAWWKNDGYKVIRRSSAVGEDEQLLSQEHLDQFRKSLGNIHARFAKLYGKSKESQNFAMEVEFKVTKEGKLVIKQARPWVFQSAK